MNPLDLGGGKPWRGWIGPTPSPKGPASGGRAADGRATEEEASPTGVDRRSAAGFSRETPLGPGGAGFSH
jgi:hypothetical protein